MTSTELFSNVLDAITFITRRDRLPDHIITEATLAAAKIINDFKSERLFSAQSPSPPRGGTGRGQHSTPSTNEGATYGPSKAHS